MKRYHNFPTLTSREYATLRIVKNNPRIRGPVLRRKLSSYGVTDTEIGVYRQMIMKLVHMGFLISEDATIPPFSENHYSLTKTGFNELMKTKRFYLQDYS